MGWIAKLLGATSKEELDGIRLDHSYSNWEVKLTNDLPAVLGALKFIISEDAILFFEGGNPSGELKSFIETHAIPEKEKVARGTIWPKSEVVHLPAIMSNIDQLIKLTSEINPFEVATHFHVYEAGKVILEWYDAFTDDMFIAKDISEEKVKKFAESIGVNYKDEGR